MNALLDYGSSSSDSDNESLEEKPTTESTKPKLPKPTLGESSLQTSVFSNPFVEAELAKAAILEKHVKMAVEVISSSSKQAWSCRIYLYVLRRMFVSAAIIEVQKYSQFVREHDIDRTNGTENFHTKQIENSERKGNTQMINGKKICWNYRKGRCRFGHNCKYAHDSDIQKSSEELDNEKQKLKTIVCEGSGTMTSAPPPQVVLEATSPTDDEVWEGGPERKKRRPGLSQGLVPGKKVIQMYKDQKKKDANKNKFK